MHWLFLAVAVPIGYMLIGAAVLATIDQDGRLFALAKRDKMVDAVMLLWPWVLFQFLTRPEN